MTTETTETRESLWAKIDAEEKAAANPSAVDSAELEQAASPSTIAPASQAGANEQENVSPREQSLLDKINGIEASNLQLATRLRNAEGHIGGLNSQLKQQLQAAQQATANGDQSPTAREVRAAQTDPEAMAQLKVDYPEFGAAVDLALKEQMASIQKQLAAATSRQGDAPDVSAQIDVLHRKMQVEVRHPGWSEKVKQPEFRGWLQRQTPEVNLLAHSENPSDAIRLLDIHAEQVKATQTTKARRIDPAAAMPVGRNGSQPREVDDRLLTKEQIWNQLDKVDKQNRLTSNR